MASDTGHAPVEARGLVKVYGDVTAVDRVDLTVEAGDVYGYLGPNGAGKTTVLRMLLGLINPTAGEVRIFGARPDRRRRSRPAGRGGVRRGAALLSLPHGPQEPRSARGARRRRRRGPHRRGAGRRRAHRPPEAPGRRLLARHAPASRRRRGTAAQSEAAAARRARHGPGPGGHARHAGADRAPVAERHDGAALQPSAGRGRGAVQPRRDRADRAHRVRGRAGRPQAHRAAATGACARPTTSGRPPSAGRSAGSTTCA